MSTNVKHDKEAQKFFVLTEDMESKLNYDKIDDKTLQYQSTFVPDELRNMGLAADIVKYALDYARNNNFKIIPSCSYVRNYISRHPEYEDLIAKMAEEF